MAIGDVLQIIAGGIAAFAAPPGAAVPVLLSFTGPALKGGGTFVLDIDLSNAGGFLDSVVLLEAKAFFTTKGGGANMTGSAFVPASAVFNNKNGAVSLGTSAAGGAANPMNSQPQMVTIMPETTDAALTSGGGAAVGATWTQNGTNARLTCTNPNAANDASVTVYVWLWKKAAP